MKTQSHKIRKEMLPILKKMMAEKKALQERIKNGGSAYDIVRERNSSVNPL